MCSVVQRQLWILHNRPGTTKSEAYDAARKEFYALRREEEIERRVHKEEALWTGAVFGKGALEAGMAVEDIEYNKWMEYALKEAQMAKTRQDAAFATGQEEDGEGAEDEALASEEPAAVAI